MSKQLLSRRLTFFGSHWKAPCVSRQRLLAHLPNHCVGRCRVIVVCIASVPRAWHRGGCSTVARHPLHLGLLGSELNACLGMEQT